MSAARAGDAGGAQGAAASGLAAALQGALRQEWSDLRQGVDDLFARRCQRLDAVVAQCLAGAGGGAGAPPAPAPAPAGPGAPAHGLSAAELEAIGISVRDPVAQTCRSRRLNHLAGKLQQVAPRAAETGGGLWAGGIGPCCGAPLPEQEVVAPRSEYTVGSPFGGGLVPSASATDIRAQLDFGHVRPEPMVSAARVESVLRRAEALLLKQEQCGGAQSGANACDAAAGSLSLSSSVEWSSAGAPDRGDDLSPGMPPLSGSLPQVESQLRRSHAQRHGVASLQRTMSAQKNGWFARMVRKVDMLSVYLDWWESLEGPEPQGRLADIIMSKGFEVMSATVIIINACFTWYTTDYQITHVGQPTTPAIDLCEKLFVAYYTIELLLKLAVYGRWFFVNHEMQWNLFDFFLVLFALADPILTAMSNSSTNSDMTFMRVLRIMKMAKILRGLRVMRFFSALRLMLNSMIGSMQSLMWSLVMMLLIFYVFGLIFVQGVSMYLDGSDGILSDSELTERNLLLSEFGSVGAAIFALYRSCTGGEDWTYFYKTILVMGDAYAALLIFFIAFSQIAFLNILTAIFVNQAMDMAKPDCDTLAADFTKKENEVCAELIGICRAIDLNENRMIGVEEFETAVNTGKIGARLSILGLTITDARYFFELLLWMSGSETQELTDSQFIEGCMRMRGAATSIDLSHVDKQLRALSLQTARLHRALCSLTKPQPTMSRNVVQDDTAKAAPREM